MRKFHGIMFVWTQTYGGDFQIWISVPSRKVGIEDWLFRLVQSMYSNARSYYDVNGSFSYDFLLHRITSSVIIKPPVIYDSTGSII